jgi:Xaa-Pro aminopeptidase
VQAALEAEFRRLGSPRNGFPSIIASGENSCVLHYPHPRARIERGDLLLVDVGAEAGYYGADVTRTFPADGRFRKAQREVYEIVLEAQEAAIETVAPGVRFEEVHNAALKVLVRGLRRLGVLEGRSDRLIRAGAHRPYFMHGTSHWLGLDVHDVGDYRDGEQSIVLRPGMVLTVEPGLYFGRGTKAPRRLRGIGVRIEDDVLVTRDGRRNLSAAIPKEPDELEALVAGGA